MAESEAATAAIPLAVARTLGALEEAEPLLEHRHRRVAVARVDEREPSWTKASCASRAEP